MPRSCTTSPLQTGTLEIFTSPLFSSEPLRGSSHVTGQSTTVPQKKGLVKGLGHQMLGLGVKRQRHHVTSISRNSANPPAPKVARRFFLWGICNSYWALAWGGAFLFWTCVFSTFLTRSWNRLLLKLGLKMAQHGPNIDPTYLRCGFTFLGGTLQNAWNYVRYAANELLALVACRRKELQWSNRNIGYIGYKWLQAILLLLSQFGHRLSKGPSLGLLPLFLLSIKHAQVKVNISIPPGKPEFSKAQMSTWRCIHAQGATSTILTLHAAPGVEGKPLFQSFASLFQLLTTASTSCINRHGSWNRICKQTWQLKILCKCDFNWEYHL